MEFLNEDHIFHIFFSSVQRFFDKLYVSISCLKLVLSKYSYRMCANIKKICKFFFAGILEWRSHFPYFFFFFLCKDFFDKLYVSINCLKLVVSKYSYRMCTKIKKYIKILLLAYLNEDHIFHIFFSVQRFFCQTVCIYKLP